jgi:hypothetical protein
MTKNLPVFRRSYLSLPPMSHLTFPLPRRIREKNSLNRLYFLRESERKIHCKKSLSFFPSPAGMSLTKLSLAVNNLIIPFQGEFC